DRSVRSAGPVGRIGRTGQPDWPDLSHRSGRCPPGGLVQHAAASCAAVAGAPHGFAPINGSPVPPRRRIQRPQTTSLLVRYCTKRGAPVKRRSVKLQADSRRTSSAAALEAGAAGTTWGGSSPSMATISAFDSIGGVKIGFRLHQCTFGRRWPGRGLPEALEHGSEKLSARLVAARYHPWQ